MRPASDAAPLVLVIEDALDARELYAMTLPKLGFRVAVAESGEEGLKKIAELLPDAVVIDWMLPGINGVDLARKLKGDPLTAHIPLLLCTGYAFPEFEAEARRAGCDSFLSKPCLPTVLARELTRLLS